MARDFEKNPYSPDEKRVCDYIQELTEGAIGCGDDPIGFLISCHSMLLEEREIFIEHYEQHTSLWPKPTN